MINEVHPRLYDLRNYTCSNKNPDITLLETLVPSSKHIIFNHRSRPILVKSRSQLMCFLPMIQGKDGSVHYVCCFCWSGVHKKTFFLPPS